MLEQKMAFERLLEQGVDMLWKDLAQRKASMGLDYCPTPGNGFSTALM